MKNTGLWFLSALENSTHTCVFAKLTVNKCVSNCSEIIVSPVYTNKIDLK